MSQETWEILCGMKTDDVELQLALQCAPLITGLKISNLLTISSDGFCLVEKIISGSFISMYPLLETEEKTVILLYQKERLEKYLRMMQVQKLLTEEGYPSCLLEDILPVLCEKYGLMQKPKMIFPMSWGYFWGIHRRMWKDSSDTVGKIASVPGTGRYMRIKRGNCGFLKNMNMQRKI